MGKEILALIRKEIILEWRQRYAINGILLYLACTVFIVYLSFTANAGLITPEVWNALFWIIMLFTSVNAVAKSFLLEKEGRRLYYYCIASPQAVILSKIIYNTLLMVFLGLLGFLFYSLVFENSVSENGLFILNLLLGATGFAVAFTMISGIASKAANSSALMTILGFPVIVPILLIVIRISSQAISGITREIEQEVLTLAALNVLAAAVAYILFPYLWRS